MLNADRYFQYKDYLIPKNSPIYNVSKKPEPPLPPKFAPKPTAELSSEPKPDTIAIVDGERCIWIPSFGWVKDEGGGSIGIPVDGEGDINKQIGVMGGGTTVGNPGDELTGHKVGIMGGGTVAKDMYENGKKSELWAEMILIPKKQILLSPLARAEWRRYIC